jgi:hypothetical protein
MEELAQAISILTTIYEYTFYIIGIILIIIVGFGIYIKFIKK